MSRVALYRCTIITLAPDSDFLFHIAPPFVNAQVGISVPLFHARSRVRLYCVIFFLSFFFLVFTRTDRINTRQELGGRAIPSFEWNRIDFTEFNSAFKKLGCDFPSRERKKKMRSKSNRKNCKNFDNGYRVMHIYVRYRVVIKPGY